MSAEPCPACQGRRLKPEALAVKVGGRSIDEIVGETIADSIAFFEELSLTPARAGDRGEDPEGDPGPARLPGQRRHRLPEPLPRRRVPLGRGVSEHPPRDADRLEADGGPLRPRRALDRPAPARQPQADRHAPFDARPGQHGHRRRARRGDDPVRRLGHRSWPGRRAPRRPHRRAGAARGSRRVSRVADREVPDGRARDPDPRGPSPRVGQGARRARGARAQPQGDRRPLPARRHDRRDGSLGLGKIDARQRHPLPRALAGASRRGRAARARTTGSRASSRSTRSSTSTSPRSAARRGRTPRRTRTSSTRSAS